MELLVGLTDLFITVRFPFVGGDRCVKNAE